MAQVEVIQADREAAASLFSEEGFDRAAETIRAGLDDASEEVQAFARHRIASLPARETFLRAYAVSVGGNADDWRNFEEDAGPLFKALGLEIGHE